MSTYNRTDRLLAVLFIIQLLAAIVLGGLLVSGLRDAGHGTTTTIVSGGLPTTPIPGLSAVPTASSGTTGIAGRAGGSQTVTTSNGGAGAAGLNAPIAAGAPIKVGAVVTETGAINFSASAQGTKAYFDMINKAGGVNGHQVQLELQDDQLDPSRGNSEVQQLINDNVFAFVGFQAPLTENGLVPTVTRAQMPVIGAYGEYDEYHTPWVFPFTAEYSHYGYQMGRYLAGLNVKTPALIYIDNGSGPANNTLVNGVYDGLKSKGVTLDKSNLVFKEQATQAGYDDVVVKLRLNNPPVDGIITVIDPTADIRLQQSLNRSSYHPTHVADPLFDDPSVVNDSSVGPSVNGTYMASDFSFIDSGTPQMNQYTQAVRASFGGQAQLNFIGEVGWFDAKAFVDALQSLGTNITRQRLMDALNSGRADPGGYTAPWSYSGGPNLHDLTRCLQLGKLVNGKVEQVQGYNCDSETTFAAG